MDSIYNFETYHKSEETPTLFLGEFTISFIHGYLFQSIPQKTILYLTNYRLIFELIEDSLIPFSQKIKYKKDYYRIPVTCIYQMEKLVSKDNNSEIVSLIFHCKDGRKLKMRLGEEVSSETKKLIYILEKCIFLEKEQFFAYEAYKNFHYLDKKYKGWNIYDPIKEFERQGAEIKPLFENERKDNYMYSYKFLDNLAGKFCETYPELVVIPNNISLQTLQGSLAFRSKNRFPILTYFYSNPDVSISCALWRSSQIKTGLTSKRSKDDETMLRLIGDPSLYENSLESPEKNSNKRITLYIYDVRPYLNAIGNKFQGKGYENISDYKNAVIYFKPLENIHCVRDSFKKIQLLFSSSSDQFTPIKINSASNPFTLSYHSQLSDTQWLQQIAQLIETSSDVSNAIQKGVSVLVHCSDGWDRTSQVCSMSQILLDPFFRTFEGFAILIEKDWIFAGHQFATRSGLIRKEKDKFSPVFIQFLDAVQQLCHQFPTCFEFNEIMLKELAFHLFSGFFGTFLSDSQNMKRENKLNENTLSVWSFILGNKKKFSNPLYKKCKHIINPSCSLIDIRIWREYFAMYSEKSGCVDEELLEFESIKEIMTNKILELQENKTFYEKKIKELEELNEKNKKI